MLSYRSRHIWVICMVALSLVVPCLLIVPGESEAATTYYLTYRPSSYNSSYEKVYPRYSVGPVAAQGIQVSNDTSTTDLYTSATFSWLMTNDFTDVDKWYHYEDAGVPMMPPDNGTATIDAVYVTAVFNGFMCGMYLYVSIDDQAHWNTSSYYPEYPSTYVEWEVTDLQDWNATILNSNETWVKMKAYTTTGIHYYLDYLGFLVYWHCDYYIEGSGEPDPVDPPSEPGETDWDAFFSIDGIVPMLGVVSFIGMIAVPALGVWIYRNSDEGKMSTFVKMLVLFMLFLSLFMVSVTA